MRVVKSLQQGILLAPFQLGRKCHLGITTMVAFELGEREQIIDEQQMWTRLQDVLGGESLDVGMPKLNGEWLLKGSAYSEGDPQPEVRIGAGVGGANKQLDIYGERHWLDDDSASQPLPFACRPLSRELCLVADRADSEQAEQALQPASIFYPGQAQLRYKQQVPEAGVLPLAMEHPLRYRYLGTYDKQWLQTNWPGFPDDFDPRFFNVAPLDQQIKGWFELGAEYHLVNLHPQQPKITGALPTYRPRAFIKHDEDEQELFTEVTLHCDTVWLLPEANMGVVLYHGAAVIRDDEALDVKQVVLGLEAPGSEPLTIEQYLEESKRSTAERMMPEQVMADAKELKSQAKLKLAEAKKKLADVPKLLNFKLDQIKGAQPKPKLGMLDLAPSMSSQLDGHIERLLATKASLKSKPMPPGVIAKLDKAHSQLLRQRATLGELPAKIADVQKQAGQELEKAQKQLQQQVKKYPQLQGKPEVEEALAKLEQSKAQVASQFELTNDWSTQASRLVALAQSSIAKKRPEHEALGIRSVSAQRYLLGYLGAAYPFKPQQWQLNEAAERDSIGPGWLLAEYKEDKFVGLTVRPKSLDSAKGEYRVQGSESPECCWSAGPPEEDAPALVAGDPFTAYWLAQDLDDSLRVGVAPSAESEGAKQVVKADPLLIPVAAEQSENQELLAPWLAVNPQARLWPLPKDMGSLEDFIEQKHNPRAWLEPYLRKEQQEAPGPADFQQAMQEKHTGGLSIPDFIRSKLDTHLKEAEQQLSKIPHAESKAKALDALSQYRGNFLKAMANPLPANPVQTFKELRQGLDQAMAQVSAVASHKKYPLPAEQLKKMDDFKQKMSGILDKMEPLAVQAPEQIEQAKSQAAAVKEDPKLAKLKYRKLTRPELEEAYRDGESLQRLDLSGLCLKGIVLSGADLSHSILSGTDLSDSDLSKARLHSVVADKLCLVGANLSQGDLSQALMGKADLSECQAPEAVFDKAMLKGAKLAKANLSGGRFYHTLLQDADLSDANLKDSDLGEVYAMKATLDRADLRGARLEKAVLMNAKLRQGRLQQSRGAKANLWSIEGEDIAFEGAELPGLRLGAAMIPGANFSGAQLPRLSMMEGDASGGDFSGTNLDGAYINQCQMMKADFTHVDLKKGQLARSNLEGANFRGANLMQTALVKTRLVGADLSHCSLYNADIRKLEIGDTKLEGINLKRTVLVDKEKLLEAINHESK
ncbi:DUF2169 family type VI secretion system accessory protein [Dongshaea marina]|uniref:DUF2169 family type VI secretion system accessory protein n=1 Tax=Dongshaea marina TaxID=2047966 RepID=UPI00131F0C7E|nr:DUF2169 domain-containing protein [Dongshaea marina]